MNKQSNRILLISVAVIAIIIVAGTTIYWGLKQTHKTIETEHANINNIGKNYDSNTEIPQPNINTGTPKPYFTNLPERLQKKENSITLIPNDGFFITTSILSNKKDKIVYSEISESIKNLEDYKAVWEGWEYNIFVKDLTTNKITKIYSYPTKTSLKELFIKSARAGGCPLVYFPITWSKNDKKIILEWGNPTWCGSGGAPKYETFVIDPNGGEINELATYDSLFFDDYKKVAFVGSSNNSPDECIPESPSGNSGVIILKDIEDNTQLILAEENNSHYSLKNINQNKYLTYTIIKITDTNADGCGEMDQSMPPKTVTIEL